VPTPVRAAAPRPASVEPRDGPVPAPEEGSRLALWLARQRLRQEGRKERATFRRLRPRFERLYRELSEVPFDHLVTPLWEGFNRTLEAGLLPRPRTDFLRLSVIKKTMFVDARGPWLRDQLGYLRGRLGPLLPHILAESPVGDPALALARPAASHNTVHHLMHLARFEEQTRVPLAGLSRIVEWGGGYGNLARLVSIWRLVRGADEPLTYTIIDTPLLIALQWLYLSSVLGEERVYIVRGVEDGPRDGAFNLVPAGLAEGLGPRLRADLFISTWALSESSRAAQDWVAGHWFGADHLLLAFQESSQALPEAARVGDLARAAGAEVVPLPHPPGNFYAFR
jgi:hypothetical protein